MDKVELNRHDRVQVIIATHSKEIINYVDASYILPVSREDEVAQPLQHHSSVLPILQDLGSVGNADLAALTASKRCVFVEGRSDRKLLARYAARMSSTVFEGKSHVVVIPMTGIDHPERYVGLDIFESFVGAPIHAMIIRDRDGLPDSLVEEIRKFTEKRNRKVVVLSRTHIENYLLIPEVIWRVIHEKLCLRNGDCDLEFEVVKDEIEQVLDSLHDDTFDSIARQIDKHFSTYKNKHLDPKTCNQRARRFMKEKWDTLDGKLSIVLGKEALKTIRRRFQEKWGITFTDSDLVKAMEEDEIHQDIRKIITQLEAL